ncbi:hypothetical protein ACQPZF_03665 [Actinosynnema sp. CS-041913]|uniref:hypothetical protein n=1 Tax=Actinosynnema sp. CS-041913 TaxID=3239917 RepID=UPI003D8A1A69
MDRQPIVRVIPDLDVPFRLWTHEDGTQTIDFRAGMTLCDSIANLINEISRHRELGCLLCVIAVLQAADPSLDADEAASIAREISGTRRNTAQNADRASVQDDRPDMATRTT